MLEIRRAQEADAAVLATFAERTFRETFAKDNTAANMDAYCAESFSVRRQRAEITGDVFVTLLGHHDGELAGYVQVCWEKHPEGIGNDLSPGEIRRIYVDQRFHGYGFGRQLLQAGADVLTGAGASIVWLAVWNQNHKAAAFYARLGFQRVGEAEFQLGSERQQDLILARGALG